MTACPTPPPDQMSWDVAIVGAGPAGSLAAHALAGFGRSVLLIDRGHFPRSKVCGGCLNRRAIGALNEAGHRKLLEGLLPAKIEAIDIAAAGRQVRLTLPSSLAVSRLALDDALINAAREAGAMVLEGWSATVEKGNECGWMIALRSTGQRRRIYARVCMTAAGLSGRAPLCNAADVDVMPRSRIGAGVLLERDPMLMKSGLAAANSISMTVSKDGYVGVAPAENGRTILAAALDPDAVRYAGGLGQLAGTILSSAGRPVPGTLIAADWRGTPALTRRVHPLAGHRSLILGDAAGYGEPFTGEGMAWAMTGALHAAKLVHLGLDDWRTSTERNWISWHRQHIGRYQTRCRHFARGLRHPWIVGLSLSALQRAPSMAKPLVRSLHTEIDNREVA